MKDTKTYEAYCLVCCGGGKTLDTGTKRKADVAAAGHSRVYGHSVTILVKG